MACPWNTEWGRQASFLRNLSFSVSSKFWSRDSPAIVHNAKLYNQRLSQYKRVSKTRRVKRRTSLQRSSTPCGRRPKTLSPSHKSRCKRILDGANMTEKTLEYLFPALVLYFKHYTYEEWCGDMRVHQSWGTMNLDLFLPYGWIKPGDGTGNVLEQSRSRLNGNFGELSFTVCV